MDCDQEYTFVIDEYTKKRGDPAMLDLSCSCCKTHIMLYQKDGPGPLLRCYWDRIHAPKEFVGLHKKSHHPEALTCPTCNTLLGRTDLYTKENRLVFVLEENQIHIQEL